MGKLFFFILFFQGKFMAKFRIFKTVLSYLFYVLKRFFSCFPFLAQKFRNWKTLYFGGVFGLKATPIMLNQQLRKKVTFCQIFIGHIYLEKVLLCYQLITIHPKTKLLPKSTHCCEAPKFMFLTTSVQNKYLKVLFGKSSAYKFCSCWTRHVFHFFS